MYLPKIFTEKIDLAYYLPTVDTEGTDRFIPPHMALVLKETLTALSNYVVGKESGDKSSNSGKDYSYLTLRLGKICIYLYFIHLWLNCRRG